MAKSCAHRLKRLCKCPDDLPESAPHTDEQSVRAQEAERINERIAADVAAAQDAAEVKHPAKKRGRGQPVSPWKVRAQAEVSIEARIMAALDDPSKREGIIALLLAGRWIDNFAEFCQHAWHVVEPATDLQWNWHHTLLCNVLQALFESWLRAGEIQGYSPPILNTAISVCPGALKSKITSVLFPVWCWLRAPGMKFVCLSVNEEVALRDARASRDLIKSNWFQMTFMPKWKLKSDQDAISNYGNTGGGERLSKPSGSAIVGLRGDILLYDDPNSADETQGERQLINQVWDDAIYSRVNSGLRSLRIGIQQRVGGGDWTDHVITKQGHWTPENTGGWMNVVLPAEFEAERRYVMPAVLVELLSKKLGPNVLTTDPRGAEGESIHPERFTDDYLTKEKRRWEGTGNYAAQFQQRPALVSGNLLKRKYWNFCRLDGGVRPEFDEVAKGRLRPDECHDGEAVLIKTKAYAPGNWDLDWICLSIDCAAKKTDKGSQWALLIVAGKQGRRYVLDDRTRRGDILEILEVARAMIQMWKPDKILIESKAAGPDLQLRLKSEMEKGAMSPIIMEEAKAVIGKEERLMACLPSVANGMVYLLDGATWLHAFVEETSEFPNGRYDDRVDALSQCLNFYYEPLVEDIGAALPDW